MALPIGGAILLFFFFSRRDQIIHRQFAVELGALRELNRLHTAEAQYYSRFGKFAATLHELESAREADGFSPTGEAFGYRFVLSASGEGYAIRANPLRCGETGTRNFFSNENMRIHQHSCPDQASAADPLVQ